MKNDNGKIKNNIKYLISFLIILSIGGLGGVIAERLIMPYLTNFAIFSNVETLQKTVDTTTIINKTENITISEEEGIAKALSRVSASLVGVRVYKNKVLLKEGNAVFATGDGYLLTASSLLDGKFDKIDVIVEEDIVAAEFVKNYPDLRLALLKIAKKDLTPISFADYDEISLAKKALVVGVYPDVRDIFVNPTTIRNIGEDVLKLNIFHEEQIANGAAVVDLKGDLMGICLVNEKTGDLSVAPVNVVSGLSFKK